MTSMQPRYSVTVRREGRRMVIDTLPDGAMVRDVQGSPVLLLGNGELPWSFKGYGRPRLRRRDVIVEALTPPGTLAALAAGYRPLLHPSADAR